MRRYEALKHRCKYQSYQLNLSYQRAMRNEKNSESQTSSQSESYDSFEYLNKSNNSQNVHSLISHYPPLRNNQTFKNEKIKDKGDIQANNTESSQEIINYTDDSYSISKDNENNDINDKKADHLQLSNAINPLSFANDNFTHDTDKVDSNIEADTIPNLIKSLEETYEENVKLIDSMKKEKKKVVFKPLHDFLVINSDQTENSEPKIESNSNQTENSELKTHSNLNQFIEEKINYSNNDEGPNINSNIDFVEREIKIIDNQNHTTEEFNQINDNKTKEINEKINSNNGENKLTIISPDIENENDYSVDSIRHQFKNDLNDFFNSLAKITSNNDLLIDSNKAKKIQKNYKINHEKKEINRVKNDVKNIKNKKKEIKKSNKKHRSRIYHWFRYPFSTFILVYAIIITIAFIIFVINIEKIVQYYK